MILSRKPLNTSKFSLAMNNLNIKRSDCVKYLGVLLDEHLSWKNQVQKLNKSPSDISGLIFKLRHYVPLATCKLIYYSLFHSVILYLWLIEEQLQIRVYTNWKFCRINSSQPVHFLLEILLSTFLC